MHKREQRKGPTGAFAFRRASCLLLGAPEAPDRSLFPLSRAARRAVLPGSGRGWYNALRSRPLHQRGPWGSLPASLWALPYAFTSSRSHSRPAIPRASLELQDAFSRASLVLRCGILARSTGGFLGRFSGVKLGVHRRFLFVRSLFARSSAWCFSSLSRRYEISTVPRQLRSGRRR